MQTEILQIHMISAFRLQRKISSSRLQNCKYTWACRLQYFNFTTFQRADCKTSILQHSFIMQTAILQFYNIVSSCRLQYFNFTTFQHADCNTSNTHSSVCLMRGVQKSFAMIEPSEQTGHMMVCCKGLIYGSFSFVYRLLYANWVQLIWLLLCDEILTRIDTVAWFHIYTN